MERRKRKSGYITRCSRCGRKAKGHTIQGERVNCVCPVCDKRDRDGELEQGHFKNCCQANDVSVSDMHERVDNFYDADSEVEDEEEVEEEIEDDDDDDDDDDVVRIITKNDQYPTIPSDDEVDGDALTQSHNLSQTESSLDVMDNLGSQDVNDIYPIRNGSEKKKPLIGKNQEPKEVEQDTEQLKQFLIQMNYAKLESKKLEEISRKKKKQKERERKKKEKQKERERKQREKQKDDDDDIDLTIDRRDDLPDFSEKRIENVPKNVATRTRRNEPIVSPEKDRSNKRPREKEIPEAPKDKKQKLLDDIENFNTDDIESIKDRMSQIKKNDNTLNYEELNHSKAFNKSMEIVEQLIKEKAEIRKLEVEIENKTVSLKQIHEKFKTEFEKYKNVFKGCSDPRCNHYIGMEKCSECGKQLCSNHKYEGCWNCNK